jgi:hypothetical protein
VFENLSSDVNSQEKGLNKRLKTRKLSRCSKTFIPFDRTDLNMKIGKGVPICSIRICIEQHQKKNRTLVRPLMPFASRYVSPIPDRSS